MCVCVLVLCFLVLALSKDGSRNFMLYATTTVCKWIVFEANQVANKKQVAFGLKIASSREPGWVTS